MCIRDSSSFTCAERSAAQAPRSLRGGKFIPQGTQSELEIERRAAKALAQQALQARSLRVHDAGQDQTLATATGKDDFAMPVVKPHRARPLCIPAVHGHV